MLVNVGFIGLGQMGFYMAKNLAKSGYAVTVFDINPEVREEASKVPAFDIARSPADVAMGVSVIFTCLPTAEAVNAVYTGTDGIAVGGTAGLVVCDCSTMAPELCRSINAAMQKVEFHYLEAPILGTPLQAQDGEVFFPVSGDEIHVARVEPFLKAMGRGYLYVGETGVANTMKILQNGLAMAHAVLSSEILVMCERLEIDTDSFIHLVKDVRGLGLSVYFERYAQALVSGEKEQSSFLPPAVKDARLAMDLAHDVDLPAPMLEESAAVFQEALDRGWAAEEMTVVSRIARSRKLSRCN